MNDKTRRLHATMLGLGMMALAMAFTTLADAQTELATINAGVDASSGDNFGNAVDLAGNFAIVGAKFDTSTDRGGAFIYELIGGTWIRQVSLLALTPTIGSNTVGANNLFGYSVATDGTVAVVGAPQHVDGLQSGQPLSSGAAYVFRRTGSTWAFETKLLGSGRFIGDRFGCSVDVQGDRIVVGADQATSSTFNPQKIGKAYVFERVGVIWGAPAVLTPSSVALDQVGCSVSLDGNTIMVGARFDDNGSPVVTTNSGAAYVYTESGGVWSLQATLRAPSVPAGAQFGFSVAISGNTAAIGATQDGGTGAVYTTERSGILWSTPSGLLSWATSGGDELGCAVATDGNTVVAGARLGSLGSGHVAVFRRTGPNSWVEDGLSLSPWTPESHVTGNEQFGTSVALGGGLLLGGAPGDSNIAATAGSATFFNASSAAPDGDNDGIPDATDNCPSTANTDQGDFDNDGIGDVCDDSDGDGLFDATELEGCSDPLLADTDNDTLSDGDEVLVEEGEVGTNPCAPDSDNDGLRDDLDPTPTEPGAPASFIDESIRDIATQTIPAIDIGMFSGPNCNANQGRRNALSNQCGTAANAVVAGDYQQAIDELTSLLGKINDECLPDDVLIIGPPDWIQCSPEKSCLAAEIVCWRTVLELMLP